MAAITITATDVAPGTGADKQIRTFGGTITAGEPVYADTGDNFHMKEAANTSEALAKVEGIALVGGADGQVAVIQTEGTLDIGGAGTEGVTYVLGGAGEIVPYADLITGNWVTLIGTGDSSGNIRLNIDATGTQVQ